MKAEEAAEEFDDVLSGRMDQLGSANLASERMGKVRNYISSQMREHGIRVRDALFGLEVLGDPLPGETFHTAFCKLGTDPAVYLEAARERQQLAPDLLFREIAPRIAALAAAGASPGGEWYSRARKIDKLDKLRRRERQVARERLHELIAGMVERMETTNERPRKALGELASALGVLASLQRYAGRRGDAIDLLVAARPLSLLAEDCVVEGDWYVKGAVLLVDLSRDARAYQFVLEASSLYILAGATAKQAEAEVNRAYVLTHAKEYAKSRRILDLVLPLLQQCPAEIQLFAHQVLAWNLRELGDLAGACDQLAAAIELVGDDLLSRAACLWSQAKLLAKLGDQSKALASFREALPLFAKLTGAAELAELAMEYAKLLFKEGRRPELRALAADLSGWIQDLRGNRKLRDAIDDFKGLIELDQLSKYTLQDVLEQIKESRSACYAHTEVPSA